MDTVKHKINNIYCTVEKNIFLKYEKRRKNNRKWFCSEVVLFMFLFWLELRTVKVEF